MRQFSNVGAVNRDVGGFVQAEPAFYRAGETRLDADLLTKADGRNERQQSVNNDPGAKAEADGIQIGGRA